MRNYPNHPSEPRPFTEKSRRHDGGWIRSPPLLPSRSDDWNRDEKPLSYKARSALSRLQRLVSKQWFSQTQPRSPMAKAMSTGSTSVSASSVKFVLLCSLWYMTSALSSNTGKAIMTQFRYPITLTFVQFGFVAGYCLLFMSPLIRFTRLRRPTKAILQSTLPMGMFQVGGHIFSSIAISRIPVSTLHTIKALSPLFTVAAYALLFGVSYSSKTYISLLPLTLGVMLACSFDISASNVVGLLCAFGSALVFVSSNIFFKKIMPSGSQTSSQKLDKLNLLFYSSGMAFILMIPLWLYHDLPVFLAMQSDPGHVVHPNHGHSVVHSVSYNFFMNGTVHFAQNLIAFIILSSTSPVTYSIASLIKRVAVICIAIVWFNQSVHPVQAFGIVLTFMGLYMYNNAKSDVEKGEKKMRRVEAARDLMLPTSKEESRMMGVETPPELTVYEGPGMAESTSMEQVHSASLHGRARGPSVSAIPHYHHFSNRPQHTMHPVSPPSLSIQVPQVLNPASILSPVKGKRVMSPVDSYPSPPPSLDSPPLKSVPLGYTEQGQAQLQSVQDRLGSALQQIEIR